MPLHRGPTRVDRHHEPGVPELAHVAERPAADLLRIVGGTDDGHRGRAVEEVEVRAHRQASLAKLGTSALPGAVVAGTRCGRGRRRRARRRGRRPITTGPSSSSTSPRLSTPAASSAGVTCSRVTATQRPPPPCGCSSWSGRSRTPGSGRAAGTSGCRTGAQLVTSRTGSPPVQSTGSLVHRPPPLAQHHPHVRGEHATVRVHVADVARRPPARRRARCAAGPPPRRGAPSRRRPRSGRRTAGRRGCSSGSGRRPRRRPRARRPRPGPGGARPELLEQQRDRDREAVVDAVDVDVLPADLRLGQRPLRRLRRAGRCPARARTGAGGGAPGPCRPPPASVRRSATADTTNAAPPSDTGQQSSSRSGSATGRDSSTSATVIGFWNWAPSLRGGVRAHLHRQRGQRLRAEPVGPQVARGQQRVVRRHRAAERDLVRARARPGRAPWSRSRGSGRWRGSPRPRPARAGRTPTRPAAPPGPASPVRSRHRLLIPNAVAGRIPNRSANRLAGIRWLSTVE